MFSFNNHQFKELERQLEAGQRAWDAIREIMNEAKQNGGMLLIGEQDIYPSRTMSKSELAAMQRMSTRQLAIWLKPLRPKLRAMGVSDRARLLKPDVVHFICKELHITLGETTED